ncbi:MAG: DNA cytosine methyltransferase [Bacteroidia bacterium]
MENQKKKKQTRELRLLALEHTAEIVFASLFAGGGGSSKGYHMAGLKEVLAIEWDKHARKVFEANFPDVPVRNADISQLTGEEFLKMMNLKRGELDVFDASPPCQAFSRSNTSRKTGDSRNSLYFNTLNLINEAQPKVFVIENVEGMRMGKMKKVWNQIVRILKLMNYYVEFKIVKAEEYSVPQKRRRLIMVGVRLDIQRQFGITGLFPEPNLANVPNMAINKVLPYIFGYSPGQFQDKFTFASEPMCTITKTASAWVYDKDGMRRKPTIDELKVLSSFPKDFKLFGSFTAQWARIGNAVPPNITKAIGLHIRNHILTKQVMDWCNHQRNDSAFKMAA